MSKASTPPASPAPSGSSSPPVTSRLHCGDSSEAGQIILSTEGNGTRPDIFPNLCAADSIHLFVQEFIDTNIDDVNNWSRSQPYFIKQSIMDTFNKHLKTIISNEKGELQALLIDVDIVANLGNLLLEALTHLESNLDLQGFTSNPFDDSTRTDIIEFIKLRFSKLFLSVVRGGASKLHNSGKFSQHHSTSDTNQAPFFSSLIAAINAVAKRPAIFQIVHLSSYIMSSRELSQLDEITLDMNPKDKLTIEKLLGLDDHTDDVKVHSSVSDFLNVVFIGGSGLFSVLTLLKTPDFLKSERDDLSMHLNGFLNAAFLALCTSPSKPLDTPPAIYNHLVPALLIIQIKLDLARITPDLVNNVFYFLCNHTILSNCNDYRKLREKCFDYDSKKTAFIDTFSNFSKGQASSTCHLKMIMATVLQYKNSLGPLPKPPQTSSKRSTPSTTKAAFQTKHEKFLRFVNNLPPYVKSDEDCERISQNASKSRVFSNIAYYANPDYDSSKPIVTSQQLKNLSAFKKLNRDTFVFTGEGPCCALHGYDKSHDTGTCFAILNDKTIANRPYLPASTSDSA